MTEPLARSRALEGGPGNGRPDARLRLSEHEGPGGGPGRMAATPAEPVTTRSSYQVETETRPGRDDEDDGASSEAGSGDTLLREDAQDASHLAEAGKGFGEMLPGTAAAGALLGAAGGAVAGIAAAGVGPSLFANDPDGWGGADINTAQALGPAAGGGSLASLYTNPPAIPSGDGSAITALVYNTATQTTATASPGTVSRTLTTTTTSEIPEPASMLALLVAVVLLGLWRHRPRRSTEGSA